MEDDLWKTLKARGAASKKLSLRLAFTEDRQRFDRFSARDGDLLLDYSKTALTEETLSALLRLAETRDIRKKYHDMKAGAVINCSEKRAVLHTALRAGPQAEVFLDGVDVMPMVRQARKRLETFAEGVRDGSVTASDGGRFTEIVNIGIGGSDLGPAMVTQALAPYHDGPRLHFVANVDGAHLADALKPLDPKRTLVILASKTFTTVETMTNAHSARRWMVAALGESAVLAQFAAVSAALDKVSAFGIGDGRSFGFWDWVGGRYSVWSAVGLPVMIALGVQNFHQFLEGGRALDEHFGQAPLAQNLPALLGLMGVWHRNFCDFPARVLLPYDQRLARFPAYIQQLDMESNGKQVAADGSALPEGLKTGPLIWGEPGTNGQHAFYQWLHQGQDIVPAEFLIAAEGHEPELAEHHLLLVANCLAQSEALAKGRRLDEAVAHLQSLGMPPDEVARLAPYKCFPGNRPSITIAYRKLDPFTLGRLIALYEHRVFVEAALWGINAFDQWGVELGKELATALLPAVKAIPGVTADPMTLGLLEALRNL